MAISIDDPPPTSGNVLRCAPNELRTQASLEIYVDGKPAAHVWMTADQLATFIKLQEDILERMRRRLATPATPRPPGNTIRCVPRADFSEAAYEISINGAPAAHIWMSPDQMEVTIGQQLAQLQRLRSSGVVITASQK